MPTSERRTWLTVDFGLSLLGSTVELARASYQTLINGSLFASEDKLHDDAAHPEDKRILGTDRFLSTIKQFGYRRKSRKTLVQLAEEVCMKYDVSPLLVCSKSRQRHLTTVRVAVATAALDERIATVREVAEFLKRKPASLSELMARHRKP